MNYANSFCKKVIPDTQKKVYMKVFRKNNVGKKWINRFLPTFNISKSDRDIPCDVATGD